MSQGHIDLLIKNYKKYEALTLDGKTHLSFEKDNFVKKLTLRTKIYYTDLEPDDIFSIINNSIFKGFIILPLIIFVVNPKKDKTQDDIILKIIMTCYMFNINLVEKNAIFVLQNESDTDKIYTKLYYEQNKSIELSILAPGMNFLKYIYEPLKKSKIKIINWYTGAYNMKYTTNDDFIAIKSLSNICVINEVNTSQFCKFNEYHIKNVNFNFTKKLKKNLFSDTFLIVNYWYKKFYAESVNFQGIFKKIFKVTDGIAEKIYFEFCTLLNDNINMFDNTIVNEFKTIKSIYSQIENVKMEIENDNTKNELILFFNNVTDSKHTFFHKYIDLLYSHIEHKTVFNFKRSIIKALKNNDLEGPICDQLINVLDNNKICKQINDKLVKHGNFYTYTQNVKPGETIDKNIVSEIKIYGHIVNDDVLQEIILISDQIDRNEDNILESHGILFDNIYDKLSYYVNYTTNDHVFSCFNVDY